MEENFFMLFGKFFVSNGCLYLNTSLDLKLNELIKKKSNLTLLKRINFAIKKIDKAENTN